MALTASYPYALTLTNPGAETGDMTGWTQIFGGLGESRSNGQDTGVSAYAGSRYFIASSSADSVWWGQTIALPTALNSDIDTGQLEFVGSCRMRGDAGDADSGTLAVECFDSSGTWLAGRFLAFADDTDWTLRSVSTYVPIGTRSVRLSVRAYRAAGTPLNVYFDAFAGQLNARTKAAALLFSMPTAITSGWSEPAKQESPGYATFGETPLYPNTSQAGQKGAMQRSLTLPTSQIAAIDAGTAEALLVFQQARWNTQDDTGRAKLSFLDAGGAAIGTPVYSDPQEVVASKWFDPKVCATAIPAGARKLVITLETTVVNTPWCEAYMTRMAAFSSAPAEEPAPPPVTANGALVEGSDTISGSGTTRVSATGTLMEQPDTITGSVSTSIDASGALVEQPDTLAGSATTTVTASGALVEGSDTISGDGVATTTADGALLEEADAISGTGSVRVIAVGVLVEDRDTIMGDARGYFIPAPQPAAPYVPPVKEKVTLVPFLDLPQPPQAYDADWMMNNQRQIIEHLNSMISAVSGTTSSLYYSPGGKAFELSVDDDGKPVFTYKQG